MGDEERDLDRDTNADAAAGADDRRSGGNDFSATIRSDLEGLRAGLREIDSRLERALEPDEEAPRAEASDDDGLAE